MNKGYYACAHPEGGGGGGIGGYEITSYIWVPIEINIWTPPPSEKSWTPGK